jgi:hypothetical protein
VDSGDQSARRRAPIEVRSFAAARFLGGDSHRRLYPSSMQARHRHHHSSKQRKLFTITMDRARIQLESCVHDALGTLFTGRPEYAAFKDGR